MIERHPLMPDRLRKIGGSFAFIEHRFLRDGFWTALTQHELLLYFFLVLAADRRGLSFYGYDRICTLLQISVDEYILARDGLIAKDLIAFDGRLFQVLSLPDTPCRRSIRLLVNRDDMLDRDPATIAQCINACLNGDRHD